MIFKVPSEPNHSMTKGTDPKLASGLQEVFKTYNDNSKGVRIWSQRVFRIIISRFKRTTKTNVKAPLFRIIPMREKQSKENNDDDFHAPSPSQIWE